MDPDIEEVLWTVDFIGAVVNIDKGTDDGDFQVA